MDKLNRKTIAKFQTYRSAKLDKSAKFLLKIGVSANVATTFSLIAGLLAIYYLFNSLLLFVLFVILHLIFDSYDGVLARLTKPTLAGKYYDLGTDSLLTFLALLRTGHFLDDLYAYVIASLFALAVLIHFTSKFEAPIIFIRTASFSVLAISMIPGFPYAIPWLTLGYLVAGVTSVYSIARQLQWFIGNNKE